MRAIQLVLATMLLVASLTGCTPSLPGAAADELRSAEPRDENISVPPDDARALAEGNGAFAFDLYHKVAGGSENVFYSPYSISLALAMTYAGAQSDTEAEMASTLHFDLPSDRLHTTFNALDQTLNTRGQGVQGKDGEGFRLNVVNAIWGQKGYNFLEEYLDTLAMNYGAGLRVLDFEAAPEPSRLAINDWVEEQTEDRIEDLIPEGGINPMTRLVLTNAVYFNAAWASQFEKDFTAPGVFHLLEGGEVTVPMMHQTDSFRYRSAPDYDVVELPYDGYEMSMVIVVPASGRFSAVEQSLDYAIVSDTIDGLQNTQLSLTMPRFKMETSFSLSKALSQLGMDAAFDPSRADFSGMDGGRNLFISDVIHKAFVEVDEAGTEAAAATAVVMEATAMPAEPMTLTIDRPFVFLIRDVETDTILFVGRVMNPG
ncbi:MAG: serpin family protein [Dehalococcoidia bacterium]|nr:serpin family protein [Dehalococcoidia bacterium]